MKLITEAHEYMKRLAEQCTQNGYRNIQALMFDPGEDEPVHNELRELGLLKRMGTKGSARVLTDAGRDWVMENRDVD